MRVGRADDRDHKQAATPTAFCRMSSITGISLHLGGLFSGRLLLGKRVYATVPSIGEDEKRRAVFSTVDAARTTISHQGCKHNSSRRRRKDNKKRSPAQVVRSSLHLYCFIRRLYSSRKARRPEYAEYGYNLVSKRRCGHRQRNDAHNAVYWYDAKHRGKHETPPCVQYRRRTWTL